MLLKDFTVYFLDFNVLVLILLLKIWFTFVIINFLFNNSKDFLFFNYIVSFTNFSI